MNQTKAFGSSAGVTLLRDNPSNPGSGMVAYIAPSYATGWQTGDIRRCWLADTVAGVTAASELIAVAADRDFSSDTGFWTKQTGITIGGGVCAYTAAAGTTAFYRPGLAPATPGRVFSVTFTVTGYSGGGVACNLGGGPNGTVRSANGTYTEEIAAGTNGVVQFFANGTTTLNIDDISITEKVADRSYKSKGLTIYGTLTRTAVASAAQLVAYSGWSASNYAQEAYSSDLDPALAAVTCSAWINYTTAVASTIVERAAASGARIVLGTDGTGKLTATAYDGTTTRTVTTAASYNTTTWLKARASYTTDGTLSISVNGRIVASTYGAPLLTLSNASAVATIGNDRTLATPFPGSIALVKWGATVPSQEAMLWMYEQEKQMFRASAQVTLPSANSLLDVAYDDLTDTITVVDSGNEASFTGLVRTSTATVPAGTYSKVARGSGVKLAARITTSPGVDITIPSQNLKEELKRTEDAARRARLPMTFDYLGGFTGNTTNGSTAIASVAGLSVPSTANLRGVTVTGTGIPASTVITDIVGSTVYISKAATATNTGVSISMLEFPLPTGYEAEGVATAGALKQEGATKDWTRSYDGFVEKIVYAAAPGSTAWVQARARRQA